MGVQVRPMKLQFEIPRRVIGTNCVGRLKTRPCGKAGMFQLGGAVTAVAASSGMPLIATFVVNYVERRCCQGMLLGLHLAISNSVSTILERGGGGAVVTAAVGMMSIAFLLLHCCHY